MKRAVTAGADERSVNRSVFSSSHRRPAGSAHLGRRIPMRDQTASPERPKEEYVNRMKNMSAGTALCSERFVPQQGRLALRGIVALLIATGAGLALYLNWEWLVATGLLSVVLILLACGAMCTTRWWSRWFGGEPSDSGSQGGSQ